MKCRRAWARILVNQIIPRSNASDNRKIFVAVPRPKKELCGLWARLWGKDCVGKWEWPHDRTMGKRWHIVWDSEHFSFSFFCVENLTISQRFSSSLFSLFLFFSYSSPWKSSTSLLWGSSSLTAALALTRWRPIWCERLKSCEDCAIATSSTWRRRFGTTTNSASAWSWWMGRTCCDPSQVEDSLRTMRRECSSSCVRLWRTVTQTMFVNSNQFFSSRNSPKISFPLLTFFSPPTKKIQIIHGDLKPENILIRGKDKRLKLIDFGFSHIVTPGEHREVGTNLWHFWKPKHIMSSHHLLVG